MKGRGRKEDMRCGYGGSKDNSMAFYTYGQSYLAVAVAVDDFLLVNKIKSSQ